jgi:NADH-quinone oxidoreductase subunit M
VILSAVYMLSMFQKVYLGEVTNPKNEKLPDLQPREWASVLPLCAMAIVMGVLPSIFLTPMEPSVKRVVERVQTGAPAVTAETGPLGPAAVPAAARVVVQGQ